MAGAKWHHEKAEQLLETAKASPQNGGARSLEEAQMMQQAAQVHATLAVQEQLAENAKNKG